MSDQADEPAMLPSDGVASGESVRPFKNSQDSAKTIGRNVFLNHF
jgi:hypothetical protein